MERAAIFVDAGYYYAQGSYAAFDETLKRHFLQCDEALFVHELSTLVEKLLPVGCENCVPIGTTGHREAHRRRVNS